MTFDLEQCLKEDGGKCRTREGRDARVICTDAHEFVIDGEVFPLVVLTKEDETVSCRAYKPDGTTWTHRAYGKERDLVNLPRKLKCWVVIARWRGGGQTSIAVNTEEQAKTEAEALIRCRAGNPVIVPVEAEEPA